MHNLDPNKSEVRDGSVALVAFGGNALIKDGQEGAIQQQRQAACQMCATLLGVVEKGYELVITHGNGPQVGNLLIQNEMTKQAIPEMPLDVLVGRTANHKEKLHD